MLVEMVQFLLKFLWKLRILAVYHDFHWLLVATTLLTVQLHSCYVKESESENFKKVGVGDFGKARVRNLERSDILPPTLQPWLQISTSASGIGSCCRNPIAKNAKKFIAIIKSETLWNTKLLLTLSIHKLTQNTLELNNLVVTGRANFCAKSWVCPVKQKTFCWNTWLIEKMTKTITFLNNKNSVLKHHTAGN